MIFFTNFLKRKKITSLFFDNVSYFFFGLKNAIYFKANVLSCWLLGDLVFFLELSKNKISFLFFQFFNKYISKIASFRLLFKQLYVDSDLEMQGLGFEIYRITKRIYRFFCGHVTYIYILVPENIEIINNIKRKKKILIRSWDKNIIDNFVNMLKLLKGFNDYRIVGFFSPRFLIRLRSGKKK